jgi:hypothetical protein
MTYKEWIEKTADVVVGYIKGAKAVGKNVDQINLEILLILVRMYIGGYDTTDTDDLYIACMRQAAANILMYEAIYGCKNSFIAISCITGLLQASLEPFLAAIGKLGNPGNEAVGSGV